MASLFLFDSVFALEGEVVTDAKQVVVMATVVDEGTKAITCIQALVEIKTQCEVEGEAAGVAVLPHVTVTEVEGSKGLHVGTEGGRETTYTRLDGELVPIAVLVVVKSILQVNNVPSNQVQKRDPCRGSEPA